tara:strand:+ start:299 stop:985 length:687 start_codon:yes stop_codon:yes gene_type:complete
MRKILIACEESQTITEIFRSQGFECWSCDIKPSSGTLPKYHIQGCAIKEAYSGKYDLMIAHPPCTYLAVSGSGHLYHRDMYGNRTPNIERFNEQKKAIKFFCSLLNAPIRHIAIENPVSVISSHVRRPDQIIQPYYFGDSFQKTTCLWLKNLPPLEFTNIVSPGEFHFVTRKDGRKEKRASWMDKRLRKDVNSQCMKSYRSKTFIGIAKAMVSQWGNYRTYQIPLFEV